MPNLSHLDKKYFIDETVYNCPFCNRNNVPYSVINSYSFDWTDNKECFAFIVKCSSCDNRSMHLSYEGLIKYSYGKYYINKGESDISDIDSSIFHSVPTSFFVIDERVPKVIRELITEAEGCLKMNFLTGASACARKAIYEFTKHEKCKELHYEDKIKGLKKKYPNTDPDLFDILSQIQDMTSDIVHEQSWPKWDHTHLSLIIETLKAVLFDLYTLPDIRSERSKNVKSLLAQVKSSDI